jgi:hypothetical protein
MKSSDPADYQDTPWPIAGWRRSHFDPRAAGFGEQVQSYPDVPIAARAGIGNPCNADRLQRDRTQITSRRSFSMRYGPLMLSLCTSRCRGTNACEPYVQHFYTSRVDPRHSKSGRTSPAPAVAHWRGCLRAGRGCALSTGGIKPGSPTPWCGWREGRMSPRCPPVWAMRAPAP